MTFSHTLYSTLLRVSCSSQPDEEGTACPTVALPQHRLARICPETTYRIGLGASNSFCLQLESGH